MNYYINEEQCKKEGLTIPELLAILLVKSTDDVPELFRNMIAKQILHKDDLFGTMMVTQRWDDAASRAMLKAEPIMPSEDRIGPLVDKLMEIFPKGKQPGTPYYFRGNRKDVSLKLMKFFKLYGDKYTDEQILNAARKYVASFNGNYKMMRLLKYFIWKDVKKVDSEGKPYIEEVSDLADYITNEGPDVVHDDNWAVNLV